MTDRSIPLDALPGNWDARPTEHPEVPSSDPVAACDAGESPPMDVYDVRQNVTLAFGVPVHIYEIHGEFHVYPQRPLSEDDVLLHIFEESANGDVRFGNRTSRIHLHGNAVEEIRAGKLRNDADGIVVHGADGERRVVR